MYYALWNSSWIYRSDKYSVSLYVILYYTCKCLCSVLKCFLQSVHQLEIGIMLVLLCHSKSAACVISIPYSGNLLREEIFANLAILLSEEIFAIFKFSY